MQDVADFVDCGRGTEEVFSPVDVVVVSPLPGGFDFAFGGVEFPEGEPGVEIAVDIGEVVEEFVGTHY